MLRLHASRRPGVTAASSSGPQRGSEAEVTLCDLLANPTLAAVVDGEAVPELLSQLTAQQAAMTSVHAALLARLVSAKPDNDDERLLTVDEAAKVLSVTRDYIYRHAKGFPFTVRLGSHLRFSASGIARFIRGNSGRQHGPY